MENRDKPIAPIFNKYGFISLSSAVLTDNPDELSGLTKREYFAAMAMQGIIAHYGTKGTCETAAGYAAAFADALLAELDKTTLTRPADSEGV